MNSDKIYFAAVGDVHGNIDKMIEMLKNYETFYNIKLSFILQTGDFQPIRNSEDLKTLAVPSKYKKMGDFHKFYHGEKKFPWNVYFIGGNHEPYGFLDKFPEGGEICPNCFYLGRANKIKIYNIYISGLSGIFNENKFLLPHPPVEQIIRIRNKDYTYYNKNDLEKLINLGKTDILIIHDWPEGIVNNSEKYYYKLRNIGYNITGDRNLRELVEKLQPQLVLCGHHHVRFENNLKLKNGKLVKIVCLAYIEEWDSIALFQISNNKIEFIQ